VVIPPTEPQAPVDLARRVLEPLWRGLIGYRVLALAYAVGLAAVHHPGYRSPSTAGWVLAAMAGWTALTAPGYLHPARWHRLGVTPGRVAVADLVLTLAAVASTLLVESPEQIAAGVPVLPTVWSAGPAIALALAHGVWSGLAGALLVQGAVLAVRGRLGSAELTDLLLIVAATLAVGYAATVLRRSAEQLRRAIELRAAVAERERLARSIHDGVLQVLARVGRRGAELGGPAAELGGPAAELAALAAEQEVALRTLISGGPPVEPPAGQLDVAELLARVRTPLVTVAVPADPVPLPAPAAGEVVAAVEAALDNVRRHVGPTAPAWILVEDDGPGIEAGRLAAAEAEGRLGVRQSIVRRVEAVGGSAGCETGAGLGCEWTLTVPRTR
jgi:signal transduction histidine kinase